MSPDRARMVAKRILLVGVIFTLVMAASGTTFALYQSGLIFHTSSSSSKLQVLATFYPQYDFTQNIGGDKIRCVEDQTTLIECEGGAAGGHDKGEYYHDQQDSLSH